MLACSLVKRTCLTTTRGLISGTFRRLTSEVLSPEKTIALLFKLFKFLMTFLAGLFEMRGCWHIGLRWAIVGLWATCLLSLPMCFRCYGNLKFPYTYNGKSGNWHLFLCYCRYFDKSFTEILPTIWILSKSLILIDGHGNRKAKFLKNKNKKKKH